MIQTVLYLISNGSSIVIAVLPCYRSELIHHRANHCFIDAFPAMLPMHPSFILRSYWNGSSSVLGIKFPR